MGNTYPRNVKELDSIAAQIFGNRFMPDQTLYEYLIEILYLIFDYPYKHYTFKYFEV